MGGRSSKGSAGSAQHAQGLDSEDTANLLLKKGREGAKIIFKSTNYYTSKNQFKGSVVEHVLKMGLCPSTPQNKGIIKKSYAEIQE